MSHWLYGESPSRRQNVVCAPFNSALLSQENEHCQPSRVLVHESTMYGDEYNLRHLSSRRQTIRVIFVMIQYLQMQKTNSVILKLVHLNGCWQC